MSDLPVTQILARLGVPPQPPSFPLLEAILTQWNCYIPWESASRIARHQRGGTPEQRARGPFAFFRDALQLGTGGTCFESNLALRDLLHGVGFAEVALVFCDMPTQTVDPHSALIVRHEDHFWLADAGFPVPAPLRLDVRSVTAVRTPVYEFVAKPTAPRRWEVHRISGEYQALAYTLRAQQVPDDAFWRRLLRDHQPDGLFLDEVIISKTDRRQMLRFREGKGLVRRVMGAEMPIPFNEEESANLPETLAVIFDMDEAVLRAALDRAPPEGVAGW